MMRYLNYAFYALIAIALIAVAHYTLPQNDVVRIVNTEVRRVDLGQNASWFWSGSDTGLSKSDSRDVRFIETIRPDGDPMVYRNEDTGWGWPPYFKFDSANLQARAQDLISTREAPQWVAVRHYGWRSDLFSIFPNAVAVSPVEGPDADRLPVAHGDRAGRDHSVARGSDRPLAAVPDRRRRAHRRAVPHLVRIRRRDHLTKIKSARRRTAVRSYHDFFMRIPMPQRDPEPPEDAISIDPEQVCFIIVKAKELDAKVEPDDPDSGSNAADDREIDILEDFADDPTLQELTEAIEALNADQHAELLAMLWLGRGDWQVEDWDEALTEAARYRLGLVRQLPRRHAPPRRLPRRGLRCARLFVRRVRDRAPLGRRSNMGKAMHRTLALCTMLVATSALAQDGPSFDCAQADGDVEAMICSDAGLADLDWLIAERYQAALAAVRGLDTGASEAEASLRAVQRGWIKGRNECWMADDVRACTEAAYLRREGELVAEWFLEEPVATATWTCGGNPSNEVVTYFFDTTLPSVRLERGDTTDVGSLVPTASGSKYEGSFGRSIWMKGDFAIYRQADPDGATLDCVIARRDDSASGGAAYSP